MKKDILRKLSDENNGYLFTAEVLSHKISKTYLSKFVKENGYERVAHGIYAAPDVWPDELYLLQKMNPKIIFSSLKEDLYELGEIVAESGYGNQIVVYDKERAICDAVINRKKMDVQRFQTAMKEYMTDSGRRLQVLVRYAEKLGIRDEVMKYVEVLA